MASFGVFSGKLSKIRKSALSWGRSHGSASNKTKTSKNTASLPKAATALQTNQSASEVPGDTSLAAGPKITAVLPPGAADAAYISPVSELSQSTADRTSTARTNHSSMATKCSSESTDPSLPEVAPVCVSEPGGHQKQKPAVIGDPAEANVSRCQTFDEWWFTALREGNSNVFDDLCRALGEETAQHSPTSTIITGERLMCTISLNLPKICASCYAPMNLNGYSLMVSIATSIDINETLRAGVKCPNCSTRRCIGCGNASGDTSNVNPIPGCSGQSVSWCCDVGRMLLIWSLCCGTKSVPQGSGGDETDAVETPLHQQKSKTAMKFLKKWKQTSSTDDDVEDAEDAEDFLSDPEHEPSSPALTNLGGFLTKLTKPSQPANSPIPTGIGYGSGSRGWSSRLPSASEQARILARRDHIDQCYFRALAMFINQFDAPSYLVSDFLRHLLSRSPLIETATELLRTSSVDDMTRRCNVYNALFDFLYAIANQPTLVSVLYDSGILWPQDQQLQNGSFIVPTAAIVAIKADDRAVFNTVHEKSDSLVDLLQTLSDMCAYVVAKAKDHDADFTLDDGLTTLKLCVKIASLHERLPSKEPHGSASNDSGGSEKTTTMAPKNQEKEAAAWHRAHCVGDVDDQVMIADSYFHAHANNIASTTKGRMKRVINDINMLRTSLPEGIFVRHGESRLDVMKVLIVGPRDTPYEGGLFEFDLFCSGSFPKSPPQMRLMTTGQGRVRFNPNLYSDGTVCLSLLGTWSGQAWEPTQSSLLQILVSIQAMIFCDEPYYNEPGREKHRNATASEEENQRLRMYTVEHAMVEWLKRLPPVGVQPPSSSMIVWQEVIRRHFEMNGAKIAQTVQGWNNGQPHTQLLQALRGHGFIPPF